VTARHQRQVSTQVICCSRAASGTRKRTRPGSTRCTPTSSPRSSTGCPTRPGSTPGTAVTLRSAPSGRTWQCGASAAGKPASQPAASDDREHTALWASGPPRRGTALADVAQMLLMWGFTDATGGLSGGTGSSCGQWQAGDLAGRLPGSLLRDRDAVLLGEALPGRGGRVGHADRDLKGAVPTRLAADHAGLGVESQPVGKHAVV
jgi:hypothetical protein